MENKFCIYISIYVYIQNKFTMAKKEITKLTTVNVIKKLYDEDFKHTMLRGGLNFHKLVNRTLDLYTKDNEFKEQLDNHTALQISGSQF